MAATVLEKIEQVKHKKYAHQWDIFMKSAAADTDTPFDRMLLAFADIFDHLLAGPTIQRPAYLGKGGKEIYLTDFSLMNAWGNGLFFHFTERQPETNDGFTAGLWCEFVGLADTRLYIEHCADVEGQTGADIALVRPPVELKITVATNQGWLWQEIIWRAVSERLLQEKFADTTLRVYSRVPLFDTLRQMDESAVFEKLFETSTERVYDSLVHPAAFDRHYFSLQADRYMNVSEAMQVIVDKERIRTIDLSSLQLAQLPDDIAAFTRVRELHAEHNALLAFPATLTRLLQLEHLVLEHNQIADIPKDIAQLQELRLLNLSNNQLTVLPKEIGSLKKMEALYIANNQLETIPDTIGALDHLRILRVTGNPLSSEQIAKVHALLPACAIETERTAHERMVDAVAAKYYNDARQ